MAVIINFIIIFLLLGHAVAQACPACLTSDNASNGLQRILMYAFMGFFPLATALGIGFYIYRMTKNPH